MVGEEARSEVSEEEKEVLKKAFEKRIRNWGLKTEVKAELLNKFIDCYYAGFLCYYCGERMKLKFNSESSFTIEHIKPRAHSGPDTVDNLTFVCSRCNKLKNDGNEEWFMRNLEAIKEKRIKRIRTVELSRAIRASAKDKGVRESYREIFQHIAAEKERS